MQFTVELGSFPHHKAENTPYELRFGGLTTLAAYQLMIFMEKGGIYDPDQGLLPSGFSVFGLVAIQRVRDDVLPRVRRSHHRKQSSRR